jgi:hypothetical protein
VTTVDIDAIRREAEGRAAYDPSQKKKRKKRATPGRTPSKAKQPSAGLRESSWAQAWYDLAVSHGYSLPYDVNYLALALAKRVARDTEIQQILATRGAEQVDRWLHKMVERWWADYADDTVHAGNAKDLFLGEDWDDLRYYARSCLRAAYLKQHGRTVRWTEPDINTEDEAEEVRSEQQVLRDALRKQRTDAYLQRIEDDPLGLEHPGRHAHRAGPVLPV